MELYSENESYKLYNGNMLDLLKVIEENSIDSIVTDPPYELNFMNKDWDNAGISFKKETWEQCFKALKPGGCLLAFGGSRTYHRIACAIEDAGFEIRDCIMWIYGSGFPKSMNIGLAIDKRNGVVRKAQNEWEGWGTQLKPSYEPIIVARKPVDKSIIDNVVKYGVGGYNIDECRVPLEDGYEFKTTNRKSRADNNVFDNSNCGFDSENNINASANPKGRFPANTILTYDEIDFEEVCGGFPNNKSKGSNVNYEKSMSGEIYGFANGGNIKSGVHFEDSGSAARYFYCAKASKKDREEGLNELESKKRFQQGNYSQSPICSVCGKLFNGTNDHSTCGEHTMVYKSKEENAIRKNVHPTVKPTQLMQYLIRLVTPKKWNCPRSI